MQEQYLIDPLPDDKIKQLTLEEALILLRGERDLNRQYKNYIQELHAKYVASEQKVFSWKNNRFKSNTDSSAKVQRNLPRNRH